MIQSSFLEVSQDLMTKIRELPVFQSFTEEEFQGALRLSRINHYEPGEFIIDEGGKDTTVYLLLSGTVRIVKNDREVTLIRRRGDIFGEMSAAGDFPRSASAYAVSETMCIATDFTALEKLSGNDRLALSCILYRVFSEILAERLRSTTDDLVKARGEIARLKERLAHTEYDEEEKLVESI